MNSDARPCYLLDPNVLIASAVRDHQFHETAQAWLASEPSIALCPLTEGALVRFLLREGESAAAAQAVVTAIHAWPTCAFWADEVSYREVDLTGVYGHRQVTDSYLVALAATRDDGRLATLDRALAARHPERCELLLHA